MEIHKKIALARKRTGLTQEQLADLTNVTVRTIQRIESGKTIPRAFTIKSIATVLGISFDELVNDLQNDGFLNATSFIEHNFDIEHEKHFLKILCLSCFSYLVIPLVHFLVPIFLLKKSGKHHIKTITFGRSVISQQIYWTIMLCLSLLLTLAYNFIVVIYFKEFYLLHYLWTFFVMYLLNIFLIVVNLWRIKTGIFSSS